jgi:branched-chain amino acid transport system ATP-binding protein
MNPVLHTTALVKRFGGITATDHVSLQVAPGARHALIGPNGAGKTTLVNLLTGVLTPSGGSIFLDGTDITHMPAHLRVRLGLVRTFQINQLFDDLTPLESLMLAQARHRGTSARWWQPMSRQTELAEAARALLARLHLEDVMERKTAVLPYGKRRLLEIGIALACQPKVLLLDEPVAGVPDGERQEILETIAALPADVSAVLIEHDMDLVFSFARRVSVLVNGALFAEGDPEQIARDPAVKSVYLGESLDA